MLLMLVWMGEAAKNCLRLQMPVRGRGDRTVSCRFAQMRFTFTVLRPLSHKVMRAAASTLLGLAAAAATSEQWALIVTGVGTHEHS